MVVVVSERNGKKLANRLEWAKKHRADLLAKLARVEKEIADIEKEVDD